MTSVSFPHAALIVHLGKSVRNGSQGIDLRKGISNREFGEMLGPLAPVQDHSAHRSRHKSSKWSPAILAVLCGLLEC